VAPRVGLTRGLVGWGRVRLRRARPRPAPKRLAVLRLAFAHTRTTTGGPRTLWHEATAQESKITTAGKLCGARSHSTIDQCGGDRLTEGPRRLRPGINTLPCNYHNRQACSCRTE
jgi:hypothetical protein